MLLGKFLELDKFSLQETVGFQELVNLFGHGFETGSANAIAGKDFCIGLSLSQVLHARLQSATAKSAERDDFLTAQVHLIQPGEYRWCVGAEPNRITEEDHVIVGDICFKGLNLRKSTLIEFFLAALDSGLEVTIVEFHRDNLLNVSTELGGDLLRHAFGVGGLGIVNNEHLRRRFLLSLFFCCFLLGAA